MKRINMADPFFDDDDRKKIHHEIDLILDTSLSMGKNVRLFEEEFASRTGVKHAIAMNSCTSTIEAALLAFDVRDQEVIVPSQTFIATGMAVHLSGGKPVFAEINPKTLCLDLEDAKTRVNKKTAGIILVHMAGLITPEIMEFKDFCHKNGLFLIEDSAHSPGAVFNGMESGSIGDVGCFSFFPSKVITSGEGGMLTTNNDEIARFARSFQNRGLDLKADEESYILPGRNVRMTEMSALLGRIQHQRLTELVNRRRDLVQVYIEQLSSVDDIKMILPTDPKMSSFWKLPVLLDKRLDRTKLIKHFSKNNITIDCAYNPPLHMQPVIQSLYRTKYGQLPITEDCLARNINLPCHPRLSSDDVSFVCNKLKEFVQQQD